MPDLPAIHDDSLPPEFDTAQYDDEYIKHRDSLMRPGDWAVDVSALGPLRRGDQVWVRGQEHRYHYRFRYWTVYWRDGKFSEPVITLTGGAPGRSCFHAKPISQIDLDKTLRMFSKPTPHKVAKNDEPDTFVETLRDISEYASEAEAAKKARRKKSAAKISPLQNNILEILQYPMTAREIADALKIQTSSLTAALKSLCDRGMLVWQEPDGKRRYWLS